MEGQDELSYVALHGEYSSSCGYCNQSDTSVAFGMVAERLNVKAYQDLINRGWRRSGTWLYQPNNETTCCPGFTHRLNVSKFTPNKEQKRTLRKLEQYLAGRDLERMDDVAMPDAKLSQKQGMQNSDKHPSASTSFNVSDLQDRLIAALLDAVQACQEDGLLPQTLPAIDPKLQPPKSKALQKSGVSLSTAFSHALAAHLRRQPSISKPISAINIAQHIVKRLRNTEKCQALDGHINFYTQSSSASVQDVAKSREANGLHVLRDEAMQQASLNRLSTAALLPGQTSDKAETNRDVRTANGEATDATLDQGPEQQSNGDVAGTRRSFEIVTVQSSDALVDLEFPLFKRYQMSQHHDPEWKVSKLSFKRFLIDTPLVPVFPGDCPPGTCPASGFGSFHQQYWIDGVLIAVGVIDVLPHCLSSKYFFWDPDLAFLSPGRLSALMEINWVRNAQQNCPSLRYYYMGYYIQTCAKMRYKLKFAPSDLLCPVHLRWVPADEALPILEQGNSVSLFDMREQHIDKREEYAPHALQLSESWGREAEALGLPRSTSIRVSFKKFPITAGRRPDPVPLWYFAKAANIKQWIVEQVVPDLEAMLDRVGCVANELVILL